MIGVVVLLSLYLSSLVTVVNGVPEQLIATIKRAGHVRALVDRESLLMMSSPH